MSFFTTMKKETKTREIPLQRYFCFRTRAKRIIFLCGLIVTEERCDAKENEEKKFEEFFQETYNLNLYTTGNT